MNCDRISALKSPEGKFGAPLCYSRLDINGASSNCQIERKFLMKEILNYVQNYTEWGSYVTTKRT